MRKLQTTDIFSLARIIRASGVRSTLKDIIVKATQSENIDIESVGIDGILATFEALAERGCEQAIYTAIASIVECEPKEIEKMPINEFVDTLTEIAKENDLKTFFDSVSAILGKN